MRIKLNQDLRGFKAGKEITIKDTDGVPIDAFWRNRLRDAVIDNCITVITEKPKTKSKAKAKSIDDSVVSVES